MNIIFFGTPEVARIILEKLLGTDLAPVCVVTSPDEPTGRNAVLTASPVKKLAEDQGIPLLQPEKLDASFAEKISEFNPDLFLVVAYGKIFPQALLEIPAGGSINVHFSLLPSWRGASPLQNSILHGDKKTGTTIMLMDEKLDHGPILAQKSIKMPKDAGTLSLGRQLAELSADLLLETIPGYSKGKIKPREQNHQIATYCKLLRKEDGLIDWSLDATQIERMIRAFSPWPGTYTFWNGKRIKIHRASVLKQRGKRKEIGQVFAHEKIFAVQTRKGILLPSLVQIEGKAAMDAETFLRGYPGIIGSIWG